MILKLMIIYSMKKEAQTCRKDFLFVTCVFLIFCFGVDFLFDWG